VRFFTQKKQKKNILGICGNIFSVVINAEHLNRIMDDVTCKNERLFMSVQM